MIYIPLPDQGARKNIFKATLRKSPIAQNVDFGFLAGVCDKFSGADITELCQRAAKSAIRDSIMADEEYKRMNAGKEDVEMENMVDAVPTINRKHFEDAYGNARCSVSQADLHKFDEFRKKMDPSYAKASSGGADDGFHIKWPEYQESQFNNAGDDDDLYS